MLASSLSTRYNSTALEGLAPRTRGRSPLRLSARPPFSVNSTSIPWALRRLVGDSWGAAPSFSSLASHQRGRGGSPAPSSPPLAAPLVVGWVSQGPNALRASATRHEKGAAVCPYRGTPDGFLRSS